MLFAVLLCLHTSSNCRTCRVKFGMSLLLAPPVLRFAWLGFVELLQLAGPVDSTLHRQYKFVGRTSLAQHRQPAP